MSDLYAGLLARAEADSDVLGVVLTESLAREGMASVHSDADVIVVVAEYGGACTTTIRRSRSDTIPISLADLADVSDRWARYAYRGAQVLLDRLDGRVAELVRAQATLTAAETDAWVRAELDGYVNLIYRAAKSRRDGRPDLARLDEIEAASWFGWTLFALYGRVRPYDKYLRWELDTHPLPPPWTADDVIAGLTERPSALFAGLETVVRAKGLRRRARLLGPRPGHTALKISRRGRRHNLTRMPSLVVLQAPGIERKSDSTTPAASPH